MEPTNIFFIITTVFVGVLIFIFTIIGFYIWKIMRIGQDVATTIKDLSHSLKDEGEQQIKVAQKLRENAENHKTTSKILNGVFLAAAGKIFSGKKK